MKERNYFHFLRHNTQQFECNYNGTLLVINGKVVCPLTAFIRCIDRDEILRDTKQKIVVNIYNLLRHRLEMAEVIDIYLGKEESADSKLINFINESGLLNNI